MFKVYSHPRSGTNFVRSALSKAFTGSVPKHRADTGHWSARYKHSQPVPKMIGGHPFYKPGLRGVYVLRDGRDVVVSFWRSKTFQHKSWRDLSFTEYLQRPLDWHRTPGQRHKNTLNIAQHWKQHLDGWQGRPGICYVWYEEFLLDPEMAVARVAEFTGLKVLDAHPTIGPVGPDPSGDYRVAKWVDVFSDDDLSYFHSIVPTDYWALWQSLA